MNRKDFLYLYDNIDIQYLNDDVIDSNVDILMDIYNKLKKIYLSLEDIELEHIKVENAQRIIDMLRNKFDYMTLIKFIGNTKGVYSIEYDDIKFYYLMNSKKQYEKDKKLINKLFKIALTLYKFQNNKKGKTITILWIPIDKNRDFEFDLIEEETLREVNQNFGAFTASGLTFDNTTIITRYEEIEKLLLHELIHNFNLDGHHCNSNLRNFKKIYNNNKFDNYEYSYDFYESYTELLSSYFNILFSLINRNITNKILKSYIIIEILYSYNVVANLLRINGYNDYEEFLKNPNFKGDICVYEYYYIKALMYNNFIIYKMKTCFDVEKFYNKILKMDRDDEIMRIIFNIYIKNNNFKYSIV